MIRVLMICMVFVHTSLSAATYHVNKSQGGASDSNVGSLASSWLTIQKAANVMTNGDTVIVHDGNYNERVTPANSGLSNSLISYVAQSTNVVLTNGFTLAPINYTRIVGFQMVGGTDTALASVSIINSTGVQVLDNWFHHTASSAVRIRASTDSSCTRCVVRGNHITYAGTAVDGNGTIAIYCEGAKHLIEYNDISHISDFSNCFGTNQVIRNNYFHDCFTNDFSGPDVPAGSWHIDGMQTYNAAPLVMYRFLLEGNLMLSNAVSNAHFTILQEEPAVGDSGIGHGIIRGNIAARQGASAIFDDDCEYMRIYNNTWANMNLLNPGDYVVHSFRTTASSVDGAHHCVLRNEIFHRVSTNDSAAGAYQVYTAGLTGFSAKASLVFHAGTLGTGGGAQNNNPTDGSDVTGSDPLFSNETGNDYSIQSGSPAKAVGVELTTTSGGGTNSTSVTVLDAGFFTDGWGVISGGDTIVVGTNAAVTITSINYTSNVMTVGTAITWTNNTKVYWRTSTPQIGALDYRAGGYSLTGTIASVGNSYTVTPSDSALVRFVIFYEDGSPVSTVNASPFTYTSSGGTVTANLYSLYASTQPVIAATSGGSVSGIYGGSTISGAVTISGRVTIQ